MLPFALAAMDGAGTTLSKRPMLVKESSFLKRLDFMSPIFCLLSFLLFSYLDILKSFRKNAKQMGQFYIKKTGPYFISYLYIYIIT